jgi:glutamate synthase (NADPH/NADH) large chain
MNANIAGNPTGSSDGANYMKVRDVSQPTEMNQGLYRPQFERDNCGFGLIAQMDDKPSHWLVETAIEALGNLTHRGAIGADGKTGDGCGLLMKKPDSFFKAIAEEQGYALSPLYAVGMVFLSQDKAKAKTAQDIVTDKLSGQGLEILGWRDVPVDPDTACGEQALNSLPVMRQIFVNAAAGMSEADFERHLYIARRLAEKTITDDDDFYIPSLSSHVVSYKGLVMPSYLPVFYKDLHDKRPLLWFSISGSLPTPGPSGVWHSLSAIWRTMVKSTRCKVTATGRWHVVPSLPLH